LAGWAGALPTCHALAAGTPCAVDWGRRADACHGLRAPEHHEFPSLARFVGQFPAAALCAVFMSFLSGFRDVAGVAPNLQRPLD